MVKYVANDIIKKGGIAIEQQLGHSFKKLHFLMDQVMNRQLQELELTNAQAQVIGLLTCAQESLCARDFEERFGLSHATVSGILSRMEAKGFIEFRPDARDRRIKRICLLPRGRACSQEIRRKIEESEQVMTAGFSQEELAAFREYLARTIENLTKRGE